MIELITTFFPITSFWAQALAVLFLICATLLGCVRFVYYLVKIHAHFNPKK